MEASDTGFGLSFPGVRKKNRGEILKTIEYRVLNVFCHAWWRTVWLDHPFARDAARIYAIDYPIVGVQYLRTNYVALYFRCIRPDVFVEISNFMNGPIDIGIRTKVSSGSVLWVSMITVWGFFIGGGWYRWIPPPPPVPAARTRLFAFDSTTLKKKNV